MIETIRNLIWSFPMLLFLLLFGSYVLFRLSFLPFTKMRWILTTVFHSLFEKKNRKDALSCISVALGGTMGIGNIVGVSSCVLLFGAGTVFWMWMSAFIGMGLKYLEIVLAMIFRQENNGVMSGGPMWNMERGLDAKWMGKGYAMLCILTSFGIGNLVPMNTMVTLFSNQLFIRKEGIVFLLVIVFGALLLKENQRIEQVLSYCVPLMTLFFMIASCIIICLYLNQLPMVINRIWKDVFSLSSFVGGSWMLQLQAGLTRGIYSNEAGLGSSSIAHAKNTRLHAIEQGAWGVVEVGLDTLVSCTLTALVVLLLKHQLNFYDVYQAMNVCFVFVFGTFGEWIYFVSMVLFAFSSMLAWCYYAKECAAYLNIHRLIYPMVFLLILVLGSFLPNEQIWQLSDICNGLMMIFNGSSLVALQEIVYISTKKYFLSRKDNGKINAGD